MGPSSLAEDVVGQLGREGGDLADSGRYPGPSRLFRLFCLPWPVPPGEVDDATCIVHLSLHPVRRGPKMTLICDMYLFLGIGNRDGRMGCPAPPNRYNPAPASRSSSSAAPRLRGLTGLSGFKLSLIPCKRAVSLVFPCKGTQSHTPTSTPVYTYYVHTRPGFSATATSQGLPYPAV
ncbi:hypothetical protein QR685DRAFT_573888 [Neurospora intermedia]|uniref:Uncharacterized protein n=1 Tax=Neurospora intermedia TaxID=5142 RepID=A0ABR3D4W9_NEUIN